MRVAAICLVATLVSSSAFAECTNNGGVVWDCVAKWRAQPWQPIGGDHASADVCALSRATCVTSNSRWMFHTARYFGPGGDVAPRGNAQMLECLRRFPYVRAWASQAFQDGEDHFLTGAQLGQLGVPICR